MPVDEVTPVDEVIPVDEVVPDMGAVQVNQSISKTMSKVRCAQGLLESAARYVGT